MTKEQLRMRRKLLGYSQTDMGRLLDIPWRTYAKWETGKRGMSAIVQAHLSREFKRLENKHRKSEGHE